VLLPFLQPTIVGTEAVRQNYDDTFKHVHFQTLTTIQELFRMSPDWTYVRTDSAGLFPPTKTGKALQQPPRNLSASQVG
jgi:ketosteroid isomerase-like protein